MRSSTHIKTALVVVLVAIALLRRCPGCGWASGAAFTVGVLAFGIVNVVASVPGTLWVRVAAVALSVGALIAPVQAGSALLPLAWLVWPPAFIVAWALARETRSEPDVDPERRADRQHARITIAAIIAAVAVGSLVYRLTLSSGLQQTAALFVGIPAFMAIVVVFAVSPRSAIGVACKAVTVALLVTMLFLQEGILCVAMSAPLFYVVAIIIGSVFDFMRRRDKANVLSVVVILGTTPFGLEGVTDVTTVSRAESVTESKIVPASARAVEHALFQPPRFDRRLPLYLRAGFPRPVSTRIERAAAGMQLVIQFRGGEMYLNGMEPRTGDLVLALEETRPGFVRWHAVSDSSHMTHFLSWREVSVQYEPVDEATTRVTWAVRYDRGLDPAWYFGPWERYAMHLAASYLIDAVATP
jgi:hypothetical protein